MFLSLLNLHGSWIAEIISGDGWEWVIFYGHFPISYIHPSMSYINLTLSFKSKLQIITMSTLARLGVLVIYIDTIWWINVGTVVSCSHVSCSNFRPHSFNRYKLENSRGLLNVYTKKSRTQFSSGWLRHNRMQFWLAMEDLNYFLYYSQQ